MYLYDLAGTLLSVNTVGEYAQIVKEKSILRNILKVSQQIIGQVYDQKDTLDIIDEIEKKIFTLTQTNTANSTLHIKDLLTQRIDEYMEIVDNPEIFQNKKVLSNYMKLDDKL
jgi:replicative DNA helicase